MVPVPLWYGKLEEELDHFEEKFANYTDFFQNRIRYNHSGYGSDLAKKLRIRPDPDLQDKRHWPEDLFQSSKQSP